MSLLGVVRSSGILPVPYFPPFLCLIFRSRGGGGGGGGGQSEGAKRPSPSHGRKMFKNLFIKMAFFFFLHIKHVKCLY